MSDDFETEEEDEGAETGPVALTRQEILDHALSFLDEFREQDVEAVTVRQMYYRFVAGGLLVKPPNLRGEEAKKWWNRQYKRIGKVLSDARYMCEFPLDGIRDGGRHVRPGDFTRTVDEHEVADFEHEAIAIRSAIPKHLITRARWHGQPVHLSVWVEKEGMESIFSDVTGPSGCGLLACKGYPSVTALYEWLKRAYFAVHGEHPDGDHAFYERQTWSYGNGFDWTEFHRGTAQECVILYFGDHDPDGWEIPRAAERSLHLLMDNYGLDVPLRFERIALNMDQIEKFNPPPFEAKMSSSRYKKYRNEHGTDLAWELDALNPVKLRALIRENIAKHFNTDIAEGNRVEIKRFRERLADILDMDPSELPEDEEDAGGSDYEEE